MSPTRTAERTILNSWKEIARYIGRAVRTVQRWEEECQLPVHRPRARGRRRSAVFALSAEIDRWLEQCPVRESAAAFIHTDSKSRLDHDDRRPDG